MEFRHLRYFLEITRDLNMTKAAERLNMSQPPLSRQIQQLEEELGTQLFRRVGKHLELTESGRFFISKAQQILTTVEETEAAMKRLGRSGHAWLNIGFVPSTIYGFLPELLRHYRAANPKIEVSLAECMSLDQVTALKSGKIDVGFGRLTFEDEAIKHEIVLNEPLIAVLPKHHPLVKRSAIELRSLVDEALILYPQRPRPNYSDHITGLFYREGLRPNRLQEVQELQTALGLVASGVGICIVPRSVQKMRAGDVIYRPLANRQLTSPVVMMYRNQEPSSVLLGFLKRVRLLSGLSRRKEN